MASIADRYSKAIGSHRLQPSRFDRALVDVDTLTVAGWAATEGGALAALIRRAQSYPSASTERAAHRALLSYATKRAGKQADTRNVARSTSVAIGALLRPVCLTCRGVRFKPIQGTGHLSNSVCPDCRGTGVRAIAKDDDLAHMLCGDVVKKMDNFERRIGRRLR